MKYYEKEYDDEYSSDDYSEGDELFEYEDDLEGGAYSEGDEYYDDSSEEMEGGAYQLDYIDGMYGNGYGGVLYGGRIPKGSNMDFDTYNKLMSKKKNNLGKKLYTKKEIETMYNNLRVRKGLPIIDFSKVKKRFSNKKRPLKPRINKKCDSNGRTYVYQSGYDKHCKERKKRVNRKPLKPRINRICPTNGRKYIYQSSYDKYCKPEMIPVELPAEVMGSGMYGRRLLRRY